MHYTIGQQVEYEGKTQKVVALDEANNRVCLRDPEHADDQEGGTWLQVVAGEGEESRLEPLPPEEPQEPAPAPPPEEPEPAA